MLELPDHHFPCQLFLYAGHLYDLNLPFVRSCPSIPLLFSYGILHTLHLRDNNNSYIKTCTNALIFVDFIYISPYNYKANKKYVSVYKIYTGFEGKKRTIDEAQNPRLDCISSQASLLCTDGRSVLLEAGQHGVRRLRLHGVHHLGFCKKVKH